MASKAIGFLNFKFGADLGGFEKAMKKTQKKLKKFGNNVKKTGKSLSTGLTLPILAFGAASIKAFDEQEKAIAQVEAGLKSTGNAVGFASDELQKMAADLQKTTLFGDEEILKGATAQLLTFTNITGEQFKKTQEVALDLATRLDGDLKSASIMLGKALNDPVANLSALSRAGIQFTEEQKSTVKAMVETNNLAGAQSLILEELEKQYGGSAEAAALAGMGPITQLKNQLSDLSEQIGERLIPYITQFTTWMVGLAEKFDSLSGSQKDNIVKWGLIFAAIGPVLFIVGQLSIGISALIGVLSTVGTFLLANPYIALAIGIAGVVFALTDWADGLWGVSDAQKNVDEINSTALKSIIGQKVEVNLLTKVLKDENSTLEEKEKALKSLNKIAPKYYGKLNAATLDVKALDNATKDYTASILQQAKAEAAMGKLKELNAAMMEIEMSGLDKTSGFYIVAKKKVQDQIDAVMKLVLANKKLESSTNEVTKPSKTTNPYIDSGGNDDTDNGGIDKKIKDVEVLTLKLEHLVDLEASFGVNTAFSNTFEEPLKGVEAYRGALGILGDEIAIFAGTTAVELENALMGTMDKLGGELSQGAQSFQEFGETVKGVLRDVIGGLIAKGITAAVSNALSSPALSINPFLIPVIAGAAAGLAKTAFSSLIPEFAEGGLVTGPTTALIGEGIGTNAGNPEVIAPLDKLKQFMGGGSQNINVTGKLVGNDIYLSNSKTGTNRERSV